MPWLFVELSLVFTVVFWCCAMHMSCIAAMCHKPPNWLFTHCTKSTSGWTMVMSTASWLIGWMAGLAEVPEWCHTLMLQPRRKFLMYVVFVCSSLSVIFCKTFVLENLVGLSDILWVSSAVHKDAGE